MLAPYARRALVCLRCEVRTACLWPAASPLTNTRARLSTSAVRGHDADDGETLLQAPLSQIRISKEVLPLNRLRKRKGKVIRETSTSLGGLKRLGDEADILVLKEVTPVTLEEHFAVPKEIELAETPDILASLQGDRRLTHDEIHTRLESLRPKTIDDPDQQQHVTQAAFAKCVKLLMDGFTSSQLSTYYSSTKNIQQEQLFQDIEKSRKREEDYAKHAVKRSEWQPGIAAINVRFPGSGMSYTKTQRKAAHKHLLVNRILQDVWHLVLMEEIETLGQMELYLKPWQITLLTAGEDVTTLEKIGQARRARIELLRKDNVVRITADKNTTEYVAQDVGDCLKHIESRLLLLKSWIPLLVEAKLPEDKNLVAMYSQSDLDAISTLSNTSIHVASDCKLLIRGFDKNAVDEAERNLIKLLPLKNASTHTINTHRLDQMMRSAHLAPVFPEEKFLGGLHRDIPLGRWSLPLMRKAGTQPRENQDAENHATGPKFSRELVDCTVATIREAENQEPSTNDDFGNWKKPYANRLSAVMGQIVCPLGNPHTDGNIQLASYHSSHTYFLPNIPSLPNILTSLDYSDATRMLPPTLIYDFMPATEQRSFKAVQMFPKLRIHMHTNWKNGSMARLHKLELRFQHHVHDVHLADEAVDVRFHQSMQLELGYRDKNIKKWTEAVIANIMSGTRLHAPPLSIKVPKWTIPGYVSNSKTIREVTYLFSSVQFRQTVASRLFGMPIHYSTIQSGKFGATGGQLHAYYDNDEGVRDKLGKGGDSLEEFVKNCFAMASKITEGAAHTIPVSKILRPRNEQSERKLRRAAERVAALECAANGNIRETGTFDENSSLLEQFLVDSRVNVESADSKSEEESVHFTPRLADFKVAGTVGLSHVQTHNESESSFPERMSINQSDEHESRRKENIPLKSTA